ncbi:hypothetical protein RND81_12G032600 [Saponaria officinalis]|uniref:Uncharacterized protein n=1 Tax=Saponaria officinalis TaxID=3572 RepID=A0AAW1H6K5_SAPOF
MTTHFSNVPPNNDFRNLVVLIFHLLGFIKNVKQIPVPQLINPNLNFTQILQYINPNLNSAQNCQLNINYNMKTQYITIPNQVQNMNPIMRTKNYVTLIEK